MALLLSVVRSLRSLVTISKLRLLSANVVQAYMDHKRLGSIPAEYYEALHEVVCAPQLHCNFLIK